MISLLTLGMEFCLLRSFAPSQEPLLDVAR
jgi:hypothetical protein